MRILVVSDTHGDLYALQHAIQTQPKAEIVLHLGDGEEEFLRLKSQYPEKMMVGVRGNCDFGSQLPWEEELTAEGKRIFFTHGYTYQVKMTLYELERAARQRKADIALYGHTHQADIDYRDGRYLMNPGSLHGSFGTYGTIDITPAGLVPNIVKNYRGQW